MQYVIVEQRVCNTESLHVLVSRRYDRHVVEIRIQIFEQSRGTPANTENDDVLLDFLCGRLVTRSQTRQRFDDALNGAFQGARGLFGEKEWVRSGFGESLDGLFQFDVNFVGLLRLKAVVRRDRLFVSETERRAATGPTNRRRCERPCLKRQQAETQQKGNSDLLRHGLELFLLTFLVYARLGCILTTRSMVRIALPRTCRPFLVSPCFDTPSIAS